MSVTFRVDPMPAPVSFELNCWGYEGVTLEAASAEAAAELGSVHTASCAECSAYGGMLVTSEYDVEMPNLSNVNASGILRVLGLLEEHDLEFGEVPAADFLSHVGAALANCPTPSPASSSRRPGVRTADGYVHERLTQLRTLAEYAHDRGANIIWD